MKRSSSSQDVGGESSDDPAKKRVASVPGGELSKENVLRFQNHKLSTEMRCYKRQLAEVQGELETMQHRSQEMETFVSVVQRSWAQLEIDTSILLDSLGEDPSQLVSVSSAETHFTLPDGIATTAPSTDTEGAAQGTAEVERSLAECGGDGDDLLKKFIRAGDRFGKCAAFNTTVVADELEWDRYTTEETVRKEEKELKDKYVPQAGAAGSSLDRHSAVDEDFTVHEELDSSALADGLTKRIAFTYSLLERLCNVALMRDSSGSGGGIPRNASTGSIGMDLESSSSGVGASVVSGSAVDTVGLESSSSGSSSMDVEPGKNADTSALERLSSSPTPGAVPLCRSTSLSDVALTSGPEAFMNILVDLKALHAERLFLKDRVTKLSAAVVSARAELRIRENRFAKLERAAAAAAAEAEAEAGTDSSSATKDSKQRDAIDSSTAPDASDGATVGSAEYQHAVEEVALLKKRLEVANTHLEEGEVQHAKAQQQWVERAGKPLAQTEAQIEDLRRAMDQLRSSHKTRVATLLAEAAAMQLKCQSLEAAMAQLEVAYRAKVDGITATTEGLVKTLQGERSAADKEITSLRAANAGLPALKQQVVELFQLEQATRTANTKLQAEVQRLTAAMEKKETLLEASRAREGALEARLAGTGGADDAQLLKQAQDRGAELAAEVAGLKGQLNDLIDELESVSSSEEKERGNAVRLMRQVIEGQDTQKGLFEENLKLREDINSNKHRLEEMAQKLEAATSVLSREQTAVRRCRESEAKLQANAAAMSVTNGEQNAKLTETALALEEAKHECKASKEQNAASDSRNAALQGLCDGLTGDLKEERRKRRGLENQLSVKPPTSSSNSTSGSSGSGGGGGVDREMLDMTLNMLRCFVCRERFKNAVITRCYHLFCSECIDRNLKNRNRKCPACGEKFGSDDVKTVYFTH